MTPEPNTQHSGWWTHPFTQRLAEEVSAITRYADRCLQVAPDDNDVGELLSRVDAPEKGTHGDFADVPDLSAETDRHTVLLLNGNLNRTFDIQGTLTDLKPRLSRTTRVVAVMYNPYLRWLFVLLKWLRLSRSGPLTTFFTESSLRQLAALSGYELVRLRTTCHVPFHWFGLGKALNAFCRVIPLVRKMGMASVVTLRPVLPADRIPSVSVVIPARNESGNIRDAIDRMPDLGAESVEVIFVEGHSTDDTWETIERVVAEGHPTLKLSCHRQPGKGKVDAVRHGFAHATGDLLTILDADLTMPPEMLPRFLNAWKEGQGDFINGNRLLYPMEGEAMRFLNHLGNIFFAKILSATLGTPLGDSLCGTKLVSRRDYARFRAWREDFGDFDPFGDYELLFPAAVMGLGIVDIPIRYRARTYGSTNIHRFRHGAVLLRMTGIGLTRITFGKGY